jgi:hypothetical protein
VRSGGRFEQRAPARVPQQARWGAAACGRSGRPCRKKSRQFEQLLSQNKIAEVTISADAVQETLKEAVPNGKREFFAVRVDPQESLPTFEPSLLTSGNSAGKKFW